MKCNSILKMEIPYQLFGAACLTHVVYPCSSLVKIKDKSTISDSRHPNFVGVFMSSTAKLSLGVIWIWDESNVLK